MPETTGKVTDLARTAKASILRGSRLRRRPVQAHEGGDVDVVAVRTDPVHREPGIFQTHYMSGTNGRARGQSPYWHGAVTRGGDDMANMPKRAAERLVAGIVVTT